MSFVRLIKYIVSILIVLLIAVFICVLAGFYAYDNVFISLVTNEGMRNRANAILLDADTYSMYSLFTNKYMYNAFETDSAVYDDFSIDSFTYRININSIKCSPWKTTASVEVEERVLEIKGKYIPPVIVADPEISPEPDDTEDTDTEEKTPDIPVWTEGIYKLELVKTDGRWKIDNILLIEELESLATPEPATPTPELSPLPTESPDVSASPAA